MPVTPGIRPAFVSSALSPIAAMRLDISVVPQGDPHQHALVAREETVAGDGPVGGAESEEEWSARRDASKPCGEGCQKLTSSGGSARWRKWENQPQSVLAMKVVVATTTDLPRLWTASFALRH